MSAPRVVQSAAATEPAAGRGSAGAFRGVNQGLTRVRLDWGPLALALRSLMVQLAREALMSGSHSIGSAQFSNMVECGLLELGHRKPPTLPGGRYDAPTFSPETCSQ